MGLIEQMQAEGFGVADLMKKNNKTSKNKE